jgi:succinate dehydrogenase / fumarate reductase cytochrome b subunit
MLSISHRITGIGLSVGTLLLVWWLVAAATGPEAFESAQDFIGSWFGLLLMFGWTFCLWYHMANGIRHLVWDAGYGFELSQVYFSGYLVIGASVGLTVLTWIVALVAW